MPAADTHATRATKSGRPFALALFVGSAILTHSAAARGTDTTSSLQVTVQKNVSGAPLWRRKDKLASGPRSIADDHVPMGTWVDAVCSYAPPQLERQYYACVKTASGSTGWVHHDFFVGGASNPTRILAVIAALPTCPGECTSTLFLPAVPASSQGVQPLVAPQGEGKTPLAKQDAPAPSSGEPSPKGETSTATMAPELVSDPTFLSGLFAAVAAIAAAIIGGVFAWRINERNRPPADGAADPRRPR